MYKADKHVHSSVTQNGSTAATTSSLESAAQMRNKIFCPGGTTVSQKNVINSIMSFLPDNRPITSLQIVEDYEKCPKNFTPIHRTYDQDADADLWRENNILFGRQTARYLCLSKTEGLPDYVLETLIVTAEKTVPPKGFSLLSRTADTNQKAWRKRQLSYKLSKKGNAAQTITDIILCSKLKVAPQGFKMAGDINGILICYKIATNLAPSPAVLNSSYVAGALNQCTGTSSSEVEKALNRINLNSGRAVTASPLVNLSRHSKQPPLELEDHDYEEIQTSYQIKSPQRPAPKPPSHLPPSKVCAATSTSSHGVGTLGTYTDVEGVPFVINPLLKSMRHSELQTLPKASDFAMKAFNDYDFQLERQTLCIMKSTASKNPFFK